MRYIVVCPNCHESDNLEQIDFNCFSCDCGEEFELNDAYIEGEDKE